MIFEDADARGERSAAIPLHVGVHGDLLDFADTILKARAVQALDWGARRFPIHRQVRYAARRPLEELFDDLALRAGLAAMRLHTGWLLLDGDGVFVSADGKRKADYTSGTFDIWAESLARLEVVRARLLEIVGPQRLREEIFTIDWHFLTSRDGLRSVAFDELADPVLLEEAYPMLGEPVGALVERYLNSRETVLVLQGPPGTGKTRLVRAILAAMSRRKGDSAKVLYTADRRTLESDAIFVEFITGDHDAFVLEDADHLLAARSNGNANLHRFLSAADGVVRAQGRKIIFTTNLPNVGDVDEALVRPGRCFAMLRTRALDRDEARRLVARICGSDLHALRMPAAERGVTLAAVFRSLAATGVDLEADASALRCNASASLERCGGL